MEDDKNVYQFFYFIMLRKDTSRQNPSPRPTFLQNNVNCDHSHWWQWCHAGGQLNSYHGYAPINHQTSYLNTLYIHVLCRPMEYDQSASLDWHLVGVPCVTPQHKKNNKPVKIWTQSCDINNKMEEKTPSSACHTKLCAVRIRCLIFHDFGTSTCSTKSNKM